jgi:hypothetical protein
VTHEMLDQIRLAQHRLIAKKLQENPEAILALARRNLQRYIGRRPAPATSLWREWRTLLEENSIDRIVTLMTAKTQKATELRQACRHDWIYTEWLLCLSQTFSRPTDSKPRDLMAARSLSLSQPISGNPADQRKTSATEPARNSLGISSGRKILEIPTPSSDRLAIHPATILFP